MTYQALYRKWRPKVFEDVVGQDHITTTLKNQIKSQNVSHAYLFSGTRGTGKTSTAKIFARAVNCLEPVGNDPCNECDVCRGIITENIMDVMEIDAASNNGVDHIREIRENVKYPPSKGKYKVYIIDEVHMLSSGAFNALLKTLEEPPSHIIFILATTEPHKLPATILSRCQRFDFKPVKIYDIIGLLAKICNSMELEYEEKSLRVIAQNGKGGLRDSLSILEQCISFSNGKLTYEEVVSILGLTNEEVLMKLLNCILEKDSSEAIKLIQRLILEGKDVQLLIKDLIAYIRQLMLLKMKIYDEEGSEDATEIKKMMEKQSQDFNEQELIRCIYDLSEAEAKAKYASQPQIILEVAIVGLCNPQTSQSIEGLLARIEELEKKLESGMVATPKVESAYRYNQSSSNVNQQQKKSRDGGIAAVKSEEEGRPSNPKPERVSTSPLDFKKIKSKWADVLEMIRQNKKAQIKAFLMEGSLEDLRGDTLIIGFKDGFGFHREALDKEKTKDYISEVINRVTGQQVQLSLVMETDNYSNNKQKIEDPIDKLKDILPEEIYEIVED